jgi:hypothetical protein
LTLRSINKSLFDKSMGLDPTALPSEFALLQAFIVGLVIPLVSSIVPIQSALSKNLNDSLDLQRSKTNSVYVQILDKSK